MQDLVTSQVTLSSIVVFLMEEAKKSNWPMLKWINQNSSKVNRIVAALAAGATAAGIHHSYDVNSGTLVISGLTVAAVWHALGDWVRSLAFQEILYQVAVKKSGKPYTSS